VVVFDARGRFVRRFGKRGGGPVELQAPLHIGIGRDGHVVVNDPGNCAFVVFTTAGEHVRNVSYAVDLGIPASAVVVDPRGGVLVRRMPAGLRQEAQAQVTPSTSTVFRQPLAAHATPSAVLRIPIIIPQVSTENSTGPSSRFVVRMDPVFSPRISFGALPDGGIAWHHESEYSVKISDATGRHVRTITRGLRPRRVTRQDQEAWRERQRNSAGGGMSVIVTGGSGGSGVSVGGAPSGALDPAALRANLPEPPFADFMSVIASIRTDAAGRIWISAAIPTAPSAVQSISSTLPAATSVRCRRSRRPSRSLAAVSLRISSSMIWGSSVSPCGACRTAGSSAESTACLCARSGRPIGCLPMQSVHRNGPRAEDAHGLRSTRPSRTSDRCGRSSQSLQFALCERKHRPALRGVVAILK
jgi:hypothetical protein